MTDSKNETGTSMKAKKRHPKLGKETEALIAASIYDELDPGDRAKLEATLTKNPQARAEFIEMRTLAGVIPVEDIEFRGDLLPALRQQIAEHKQKQLAWLPLRWFAPFAVAGIVVGTVFTYGANPFGGGNATPATSPVPSAAGVAALPLHAMLEEADAQAANKNWIGARDTLNAAISKYPADTLGADARARLADLHFSKLHEYPQAYAEYQKLRDEFPQAFAASPLNVDRFNILAEAKADNYEALHMLDEARDSGADIFQQLEGLIARHPDTFVASLAVDSLREQIPVPKALSGESQVVALEAVRDRCTHPVAIAQVNMSLGRLYAGELGDVDTARSLYQSVAETGPVELARSAKEALSALALAQ